MLKASLFLSMKLWTPMIPPCFFYHKFRTLIWLNLILPVFYHPARPSNTPPWLTKSAAIRGISLSTPAECWIAKPISSWRWNIPDQKTKGHPHLTGCEKTCQLNQHNPYLFHPQIPSQGCRLPKSHIKLPFEKWLKRGRLTEYQGKEAAKHFSRHRPTVSTYRRKGKLYVDLYCRECESGWEFQIVENEPMPIAKTLPASNRSSRSID